MKFTKIFALALALMMLACAFAACGGDTVDTTEPVVTDPVVTEPAETEPAETDPVETEPAVTEPVAVECEHDYGTGKKVNATCQSEGYTEYTCKKCGETKKENVVGKVDHLYTTVTLVAATCTVDGETAQRCSFCGNTINNEIVPALGCDYVKTVIESASPTHHTAEAMACVRCGNVDSAKPLDEHEFKYVEGSRVADSSTPSGSTVYGFEILACDCGYQHKVSANHADGHYYELDPGTGKYVCGCGSVISDGTAPAYNGNENAGPVVFAQD